MLGTGRKGVVFRLCWGRGGRGLFLGKFVERTTSLGVIIVWCATVEGKEKEKKYGNHIEVLWCLFLHWEDG